jgi:hypothetical protein
LGHTGYGFSKILVFKYKGTEPSYKKVQRSAIFVEIIYFLRFEGAAHRNIKLMSRCAAPSNPILPIFATNLAVRCA